jgi:DNA-directed RNA polymerase beta' subunit
MEMMNSSKKKVVIREGNIQEGQFDKSVFSKASRGIIHMTFNDYGSKQTVDFIDSMQNTVEQFLVYNGFSVGISDLIADSSTKGEMNVKIQEKKSDVETILLSIHHDLFDNNTGKTNQAEFEDKIFGILNKATELAGDIGYNSLANENRMTAMVRAGSKGGPINIAQMIACVGQQNIDGKRIPYGFEDRTLPHFKKYDDGAEARGFIENSFISGLTPTEFFFHAMSGREGLIDTAVKTADTGYIQRQLVKAMEDLVVQHDGTVRDANMNISQFHYGEDGINSTKIEAQSLELSKLSDADILRDFGLQGIDLTPVLGEGVDRGNDAEALASFADAVRADRKMVVEGVFRSGNQGSIFAAVNLERLILTVKIKFDLNTDQRTNLTPTRVLQGIEAVLDKTQRFHRMWAALLRFNLCPMKIIVRERFTESAFDTLCEMIVTKNWQAWAQPGEQVGIIAAQSIGEPSTQMTLNSVDWDTRVMIAKNGEIVCPEIGDFIDSHLSNNASAVKKFPNNQEYLELNDGNDWQAISCDENGKMMWTKLEAVTRHPVLNEDGTNTILEVELDSGRITKATKGKSFLTLIDGKIKEINGSELKIGDILPIANSLAIDDLGYVSKISLRKYLPPTEWLYGTDVNLALVQLNSQEHHWFQKNNGNLFTIPYSRSDSFREAFVDGKNTNAENILPGYVYPARTRPDVSQIPEDIPLTQEFGFFAGAYLAEGMSNNTQVNITNNDHTYLQSVKSLMDSWNLGTHLVSEERDCVKTGIKGTTTSLVIHSTLLATLMQKLFGRVSGEKTLPDWVIQAPHPFIKGLVDAYIGGDGTVDKKSGSISATSISNDLLVRFRTLFSRYGIFARISSHMPSICKFNSVRMAYTLTIPVHYSRVFADNFKISMGYKQEILDYHFGLMEKGLTSRREMTGEVIWDTIKSIKEVSPIKERVYDFTVEHTKNFMTYSGHLCRDTFHLAGVASKSNVTRGVPRLKELLKVSQNPKAISLTIPLKKEYSNSKAKAREVAQELELTLLRDMTIKTAIYYDPTDSSTVLKEDRELLMFYKMFEATEQVQESWSKYILRLEFNRQNMFDKNITMDDILFVLRRRFEDEVQLVYSDFNSKKLVMRIRLSNDSLNETKTDPASLDALSAYKKFQNKLLNSVIIRGLPGIKAVTFRKGSELLTYNKNEGKYETREEYILDTDGTNLLEVMNHPAVDATRVTSTHVHDIYPILGIEATRHILYTEITTLFEEGQINYRHLGLLVDVMTRAGRLMSVDRYGINKLDIGPLAKASFEETERILLKAAVFGEIDPVTGVSANIMTGQPIRGGTAFSDILLDEVAVLRLQKGLPQPMVLEGEAPFVEDEDEVPENDMCNAARLKMNLTLPTSMVYLEDEPDIEFSELQD